MMVSFLIIFDDLMTKVGGASYSKAYACHRFVIIHQK